MRRSISPELASTVVLRGLFVVAAMAWSFLWLAWASHLAMMRISSPALSWPAALALVALGAASTRWLARDDDRQPWLVVAASLAAAVILIAGLAWLAQEGTNPSLNGIGAFPTWLGGQRGLILALLFGAFFWWQGMVIGRADWYFEDATMQLGLGTAVLVVGLIATAATGSTMGPGGVSLVVLQFYGAMLPALALMHLEDIRRDRSDSNRNFTVSREWFGVLAVVVVLILAVALGLAAITSPKIGSGFEQLLIWLDDGLVYVVLVAAYPIGYLVAGAVWVVRELLHLFGGGKPAHFSGPPSPSVIQHANSHKNAAGIPGPLVEFGRWALLVLVVTIVLFLLYRAFTRYRSRRAGGVEEVRESLWPAEGLFALFLAWLRSHFRRPAPADALVAGRVGYAAPPTAAARSVREYYLAWLRAARTRGQGRLAWQTPAEFARSTRVPPVDPSDVARLTEAYEWARYGAPPLSGAVEDLAETSWRRIREQLGIAEPNGNSRTEA